MPTYHFTGPSHREERRGKCPTCGKTVKRSRTFEKTVNPFNRDEDGVPKTWERVHADVLAEAAAWTPDIELFEHQKCYDQRQDGAS